MKYIITESKLETAITEYINELFPIDNIHSTNPPDVYGNEDENRILFYIGDYDDDDNIFRWYDCEYFYPESGSQDICPIVSLEVRYKRSLNSLFDNLWKEPFKKWFTENFDLPVKTIDG
jgi:hypothetical protein